MPSEIVIVLPDICNDPPPAVVNCPPLPAKAKLLVLVRMRVVPPLFTVPLLVKVPRS